jgi:hypothetical protein
MLPSSGGASTLRQAKPRPSLSNSQNDKAVRERNFNNLTLLSVLGYLLLFSFLLSCFFFWFVFVMGALLCRKGAVSNPTRPYLAPCRGIAMVMRTSQVGHFWAYGTWAGSDHHRPSARPGRLPFPTDKTKKNKLYGLPVTTRSMVPVHNTHNTESEITPGPIFNPTHREKSRTESCSLAVEACAWFR